MATAVAEYERISYRRCREFIPARLMIPPRSLLISSSLSNEFLTHSVR